MNRIFNLLAVCLITLVPAGSVSCSDDDILPGSRVDIYVPEQGGDDEDIPDEENNEGTTVMVKEISIAVNDAVFSATLEDNPSAQAFAAMFPLTVRMNELNGNEKYHYLDSSLPTDASRVDTIRKGDLMLYGSTCIVVFYKTFSSGYSYTRLGSVDNPDGLETALGSGNVTVTFSAKK